MIICVAALLLFAVSAVAGQLEVIQNANIRSEPNNTAPVIGSAREGAIVSLIEEQGTWYKIQHEGREGWIFNRLANPIARSSAEDMFTRQNIAALPPAPETEEQYQPRYAQVIRDNTHILETLAPGSPLLHIARRGEVFILDSEGESWCRIVYEDTIGWVRRTSVEIFDTRPTTSTIVSEAKSVLIFILIGGVIILAIFGIVTYRHIQLDRKRKTYVQKNVLIIAKDSKPVQHTLTNAMTTMERCFSEIGLSVNVARDSVTARNCIEHNMPDLILVDWNFEASIYTKIDNLFVRMAQAANPCFLFYNVPDLSAIPTAKALRNVSFLGLTVSDRDIFKVVTPIIARADAESPKDIQKSVQRCALEGEIAGGNLLEVLQFIEIGSKTGCLMIETKGPFGLVYFRDGMIIYAAAAKGQGVDAVYAILDLPFGKFRFITNKHPKTANLCLPTLSVLMEWTKEKDEAGRR
jgi:uncharacterized protein YraI